MAYIKRTKYVVNPDNDVKEAFLEEMYTKDTIKPSKARQLVYYSVPMSLIRWGKYITPEEAEKYLVPYEEETEEKQIDIGI